MLLDCDTCGGKYSGAPQLWYHNRLCLFRSRTHGSYEQEHEAIGQPCVTVPNCVEMMAKITAQRPSRPAAAFADQVLGKARASSRSSLAIAQQILMWKRRER